MPTNIHRVGKRVLGRVSQIDHKQPVIAVTVLSLCSKTNKFPTVEDNIVTPNNGRHVLTITSHGVRSQLQSKLK